MKELKAELKKNETEILVVTNKHSKSEYKKQSRIIPQLVLLYQLHYQSVRNTKETRHPHDFHRAYTGKYCIMNLYK